MNCGTDIGYSTTKIVSDKALEEAVLDRVPPGTEELNKKALRVGMEAALEYGKKHMLEGAS